MPVIRASQYAWDKVTRVANELGCSLTYALDRLIDGYEEKIRELEAEIRNFRVLTPEEVRKTLRGTNSTSQRAVIDVLYKLGYRVVKMGAGG